MHVFGIMFALGEEEVKTVETLLSGSSPMAQQVKDPALSLQRLWSLLWCRLDPWPETSWCLGCGQKKKKKKNFVGFQELRIGSSETHMYIKEKQTKNDDIHGASK